jgi:hypothetical protein
VQLLVCWLHSLISALKQLEEALQDQLKDGCWRDPEWVRNTWAIHCSNSHTKRSSSSSSM